MLMNLKRTARASLIGVLALASAMAFGQAIDRKSAVQEKPSVDYSFKDLQFDLLVKVDPALSAEQLALILPRDVTIKSRERGTTKYKLRVKSQEDLDRLNQWCLATKSVSALRLLPVIPKTGIGIRSIASIEEYKERAARITKETGQEVPLGAMESLLFWVKPRAFPYDGIDYSAYEQATIDRQKLDTTVLPGLRIQAGNWEFLGPTNLSVPYNQYFGQSPVNGRINALAVDPNNANIIYAGAAAGGIFKTTDGGATWNNITASWTTIPVNCIAMADSNTIYAGLGDLHGQRMWGTGVMKSTDAGASWTQVGAASLGSIGVSKIVVDPDNANNLVCTTSGYAYSGNSLTWNYGRIYRSTNGGSTWTAVQTTANIHWTGLSVSLPNGSSVRAWYAAASAFATNRIYRSLDGGATWTALANPAGVNSGSYRYSHDIAASKLNADTVYFLAPDTERKIYKSVDRGANWTDISAGFPNGNASVGTNYNWSQGWYDYHINTAVRTPASGPATDMVYVGLIDLVQSIDGGTTWTSVAQSYANGTAKAHSDQHCWAVSPSDPNTVFFGNDGGVFKNVHNVAANTNTVTSLNATLGATMFYDIAAHPTTANILLGGAQDNSSPYSNNNLANWTNPGQGDGGYCVINQDTPAQQYLSVQNMNIFRTTNSWSSKTQISSSATFSGDTIPFIGTLVTNEANRTQIYAGTNYLNKYDPTAGWTKRLGATALAGAGSIIKSIASHSNGTRIYTGSEDGKVYMSNNGGTSWTLISNAGLPARSVMAISITQTADNDILVGLSGTGSSHVYRCSNTDAATPTWTNVSGGGAGTLPDIPVNTIARDLADPGSTWWIGTDFGVFQTNNAGSSWTDSTIGLGLPAVPVTKLVAVPGTQYLNAGTYGRGMWRLLITGYSGFVISPNTVVGGSGTTVTGNVSFVSPLQSITTFNVTSSDTSAVTVPATVNASTGSTGVTIPITHLAVSTQKVVTITVQNATFGTTTATLTVNPNSSVDLSSVSVNPTSVTGGTNVTGTVTLTGVAPAGGTVVNLSSSNGAAMGVAGSVTVPAGSSSQTFNVTTGPVASDTTATLTATLGATTRTATLTVLTPVLTALSTDVSTIVGGNGNVTGTVTLNGPAPTGGKVVSLSSNNTTVIPIAASVTVPAGQSTATFTVTPTAVASTTAVTLTATLGAVSKTAVVTVNPMLAGISITPSVVTGGAYPTGTVTLNTPAPAGGITVTLSSSLPAVAAGNGSITIPAGSSSGNFLIGTNPVATDQTVTFTATYGPATRTANLSVLAPVLTSLFLSRNDVVGGADTPVTGTVTLNDRAPASGMTVTLSSNNGAVTVPGSIVIPSGATSFTFSVNHVVVGSDVTVTITATMNGVTKTQTLAVISSRIATISVAENPVSGGAYLLGTITLNKAAPAGGTVVTVTNTQPAAVSHNYQVTVPGGQSSTTFLIGTSPVSAITTAYITGDTGGYQAICSLTVLPPVPIQVFLSHESIPGGSATVVTGYVKLSSAAGPSGQVVTLNSSDTSAATVPATVTVPAGSIIASFTITHLPVSVSKNTLITATTSGETQSAWLNVRPN